MSTPGQTIGPFFGFALPYAGGPHLLPPGHADAVRLHGIVRDGAGDPVPDAVLELWQAGPDGPLAVPGSLRRDGWTFTGWGRTDTDLAGGYSFTTRRPVALDSTRPAFVSLVIFARGLLDRLFTRCYLPASEDVLLRDPLLASLDSDRRATLVADEDADGLRFDITLQGEAETVFLEHGGARG